MLLLSCNIVIAIHLKTIDFSPLCSKYKMEIIMMHKTYLVLGSSPKFHIVPWQDVRQRNPHFWDLDVERTKRNFPSSRCFLALEPCLRRDCFFPLLFPNPQWSRQNVRVLFSLAHRPKDPGPNSCSFGGLGLVHRR